MTPDPEHWFEPTGEISLRQMVHDGLKTIAPLEPGSTITHDAIAGWLGEPFPRITAFGERDYHPMGEIKADLLRCQGVLLLPDPGSGYFVANAAQMVDYAERHGLVKAMHVLDHAGAVLRATNPERLNEPERRMRDHLETEAREAGRLLRNKRRAFLTEQRKWSQ